MMTQAQLDFGAVYPARPPFFFAEAMRIMSHYSVAQDVGCLGALILFEVVLTEDRRGYRSPPKFWMRSFQERFGRSRDAVSDAVRICADHGWLYWHQPCRRKQATAWLTLPSWVDVSVVKRDMPVFTTLNPAKDPAKDSAYHPAKDPAYTYPSQSLTHPTPEWAAAAKEIQGEGITDWQRPLRDAARNGLTPQAVSDLIAYWRSVKTLLQSPLGALHYAIRHAEPRHAESNWAGLLPLSEEALRLRRRAEREAQQRRDVSAAVALGDASPDARLRQLEFAWNAKLSGQPIRELITRYRVPEAIAARLGDYRETAWSSSLRMAPTLKLALLEHLAAAGSN